MCVYINNYIYIHIYIHIITLYITNLNCYEYICIQNHIRLYQIYKLYKIIMSSKINKMYDFFVATN